MKLPARVNHLHRLFPWLPLIGGAALAWFAGRQQQRQLIVAQRQIAALSRVVNDLAAEPNLDVFLGSVLTAIAEQMEANWVGLFFHDADADLVHPHLIYDGGTLVADEALAASTPVPMDAQTVPVWQELCATRQTIFIQNIAEDERLRNRAQLQALGVRTLLVVPLVSHQQVIGWYSLRSTKERRYSTSELDLAQALAQQIVLAIQLTRLAERDRESAILAERNRMAREIHDTLAQGFTGINWQLEAVESALLNQKLDAAQQRLEQARALARDSLAEARRSVWALRPTVLEQKPLGAALRDSVQMLTAGTDLAVQISVADTLPPLPAEAEVDLLRVIQEAVTNVVKHADADTMQVALQADPQQITLHVQDDGRGWNPAHARTAPQGGFGLTAMRERVERHGGTFSIQGEPGRGTRIMAMVPLLPETNSQKIDASEE